MAHRPIDNVDEPPAPLRSWAWSQHWHDVLFLHWRVDAAALRSRIPTPLEVDTHDGDAWVSMVLFRLRLRLRGLPFLPGVSDLVEVNLRTYVHCQGKPGICFLSVHADNRWAILLARLLTPIPYAHAAMRYKRHGEQFEFLAGYDSPSGTLAGLTFAPTGEGALSREHSVDEWLLERYRLFAFGRCSAPLQAEVAHPRWVARCVQGSGRVTGFVRAIGLDLPCVPEQAHFAPGVWARFGPFQRLEGTRPNQPLRCNDECQVPSP